MSMFIRLLNLNLGLVSGHNETKTNRELSWSNHEGKLRCICLQDNPGNPISKSFVVVHDFQYILPLAAPLTQGNAAQRWS